MDQRRERLLRCGVELLDCRPAGEISVAEIAARAGVARGLLYHYFSSKEELILAALARRQAELTERMESDASLPAEKRLEACLAALFDHLEERSSGFASICGESPTLSAALKAEREKLVELLMQTLAGLETSVSTMPGRSLEIALHGWLFFCEGAQRRWRAQAEPEPGRLRILLRSAFDQALLAAAAADRVPLPR